MFIRRTLLALVSVALCLAHPSFAATLCVDAGGAFPCYVHIADAVNAAAPGDTITVGPGTFYESVTITKPLSLTTNSAILDATGQTRGFFVNGMAASGLANVNISGFTVRNAKYEGILVLNASSVTVSNNMVMNNNQALSQGACPGLDSFETNEQSDCGEGIHLLGADHSVVMNNTVTANSGGILLSDDTASTHNNLVSFNNVTNNPYACGITLASHPPFSATATASFGVYQNVVYGNRSNANGLANGGGAGAGIYASVPGAMSYSNVIVANYLNQNGLPGVAMHAHAPGQNLNDNIITANTVVNNGPDTEDAATPGPTGINLYSLTPVTGNMIVGNSVQGEAVDVAVKVPAPVQVQLNQLQDNGIGVANLGVGPVNATENFWSCSNGPVMNGSCSTVLGNNVLWTPWLTNPMPTLPSY